MKPLVIPAVLSRHAEEAAFLWLLRDLAVRRPQYNLRSLAELDQRVEAHLDGLRVAGEQGWERIWQELEARPEPGEVFASAVLAFESTDPNRIQNVLARSTSPRTTRAVVSALGWLSDDIASVILPMLTTSHDPFFRLVGLSGMAERRVRMGWNLLESCLNDPDMRTRTRALRATGELGYADGLPPVRKSLRAAEPELRFAAAWTLVRLGDDSAVVSELQSIALTEPQFQQSAATMAVRRLEPAAARRWIDMLRQTPGGERAAIQASGVYGDPVAVPQLLELMSVNPFARLAGEAFTTITGIRFSDSRLDRQRPEGFESGPTEDPDDPSVELDSDDGLDWPDPEKVNRWWSANRGNFRPGTRYVCGKPVARDHLKVVLQTGYQRQRATAALELGLLLPREPLYPVKAPAWRQQTL